MFVVEKGVEIINLDYLYTAAAAMGTLFAELHVIKDTRLVHLTVPAESSTFNRFTTTQQQYAARTCSSGVTSLAAVDMTVTALHRSRLGSTVFTAAPLLAAWATSPLLVAACLRLGWEMRGAPTRKPPTRPLNSQSKTTDRQATEASGGDLPGAITTHTAVHEDRQAELKRSKTVRKVRHVPQFSLLVTEPRFQSAPLAVLRVSRGRGPCFRVYDKETWLLGWLSAASLEPWLRFPS